MNTTATKLQILPAVNEAVEAAHDAIDSGDKEAVQWARARLCGLLDLDGRKTADSEDLLRRMIKVCSDFING